MLIESDRFSNFQAENRSIRYFTSDPKNRIKPNAKLKTPIPMRARICDIPGRRHEKITERFAI
jgi:hypothetical protein